MLQEFAHHVGVHIAQHPKETLAAVVAAGKVVAPVAIFAAPYVAGAALVGGTVYGICQLFKK